MVAEAAGRGRARERARETREVGETVRSWRKDEVGKSVERRGGERGGENLGMRMGGGVGEGVCPTGEPSG